MIFRNLSFYFLVIGSIFLAACGNTSENRTEDSSILEVKETLTKSEPVNPFPEATRVNLLAGDAEDTSDLEASKKPEGTNLSSHQIEQFASSFTKVTRISDEVGVGAACFIPHHFLRYYNKKDELIGEIDICFCCYEHRASPSIVELTKDQYIDVDYKKLENLIRDMGLPTDIEC